MDAIRPIEIERMSARQRVELVLSRSERPMVSTSFGIQSALLLHMVASVKPDIPVVFVDTGFLFPETLSFGEMLQAKLGLNLHVYRPLVSPRELVAQHGNLWENGEEGLTSYNQIVKVEPMERALIELAPDFWFAGLRRSQSATRSNRPPLEPLEEVTKCYPIIDWTDRDVYFYLKKHDLPYHPLWEKGYLSLGDVHSSAPLKAGREEESTRFGGVKRECGLHNRKKFKQ